MNPPAYRLPASLSLRANFSWTIVGNVVYAGCQWGMLVALAKLGSPEMVGQFALGLAITAPMIMFTNLNLRAIQATDARQEYRFGDYLGLRLVSTGLTLVIVGGIALGSEFTPETRLVVLAVGLAKVIESISDIFYGLQQQHERMDRIAKSMIVRGVLSLAVLSLTVYLTQSVFWGAVGMAIVWAVILAGYDVGNGALLLQRLTRPPNLTMSPHIAPPELCPQWDILVLGKLVWLALPLGLVMMLISLNENIPRYFIKGYLGEHQLGIFAAIAYLQRVGLIVVNALGQSAAPRLARHYAAGEARAFSRLLGTLAGFGVLLGVGGVFVAVIAGQNILTLLYRPEYAHRDIFVLVMVAAGITYVASILGYGMTAARRFRVQVPLFVLVTGLTALLGLWLIPVYGLSGAVAGLIVAAVVQGIGSLAVVVQALLNSK